MIYCLVDVSVSQSRRKCSISSVAFVLHISQCVWPAVCRLSMLSFSVPVLALNNVVVLLSNYIQKMSLQFRLGGGSFNRKASSANRVFVELLCCSISSHKYNAAVRSIKAGKRYIIVLYTIHSLFIFNQCR